MCLDAEAAARLNNRPRESGRIFRRTLKRIGVSPDVIQEGQRVKFAGWPSLQQDDYMALTHLFVVDSNMEVVMRRAMAPRWSDCAIGGADLTSDPRLSSTGAADGIFRVWSFSAQRTPDFAADPPSTPSARAAFEPFDPVRDDPVLNCAQPGMPEAITFIGPHPIEFVDRGDQILLRIESDDTTRVIHMGEDLRPDEQPLSSLGFSVGRWENKHTLVVTTTRVSCPWAKLAGLVAVPQSRESVFTERFTMSEAQIQLTYGFSISDPETFTRSVSADGYTVWRSSGNRRRAH